MRSNRLHFCWSLALLTASSVAHGQADCPQSYVQVQNGVKYSSNAPDRSLTAGDAFENGSAQYDLSARTFRANAHAALEHAFSAQVGVMARCIVAGPAPGTPLTFAANLHVTGSGQQNGLGG